MPSPQERFTSIIDSAPIVPAGALPVSIDGGRSPQWRADGRELFYFEQVTGRVMAVSIEVRGGRIVPGTPHPLPGIPGDASSPTPFDVDAEGQLFLVAVPERPPTSPPSVVVNALDAVRE